MNGLATELSRLRRELKSRRRSARFAAHSHRSRHLFRQIHEIDRLERSLEDLEHSTHTPRRKP